MNIGTKTLFIGNHNIVIHPVMVYIAWVKLYHQIPNPKEALCILIHDWGYWGLPNLDGQEGEQHPYRAGHWAEIHLDSFDNDDDPYRYRDLCWYHSRFFARQHNHPVSKLCLADKYGVALLPTWLWVMMGRWSGEIKEYRSERKYEIFSQSQKSDYEWFRDYKKICKKWIETGDLTIKTGNTI